MKGSEIIINALLEEGVDAFFGYPGGGVIPFFDAHYDYAKKLKFYLVRHEQAAAHAADGYARSTGKVGVCVATTGPGATNLVTGIATANMDSIPMVAITGQVKSHLIGNDAFQEADIIGVTRSISKHNFLVKDVKDLAQTLKEAFYIARSGRPGPVLVDVPTDVQNAECDFDYSIEVDVRSYKPNYQGHTGQIKRAIKMIKAAKKPLLMIGGGIISSEASAEVTELARKLGLPTTATLMGLGGFPESDELYMGYPGMHGTVTANLAIQDCDVMLAIGNRFDDRVTGKLDEFAVNSKIIHVDIDPTSISKNIHVDIPIVGDAKTVIQEMLNVITDSDKPEADQWREQIATWKKENPLTYGKSDKYIKPQAVIEKLNELNDGNIIMTTEVGQHQMWAAQYFQFEKPRQLCTSGGLGTMGYGFPAAIGAAVANPDKQVVCIAGDGSIQMNIQELGTASAYNIPVKVIILNNNYLGMVRQWQELFYDRRYAATPLKNPDFVKVAEGYKVAGKCITKTEEIEDALKEMLAHNGPYFLEVKIEPEENVYPMVPAGAAINMMIGGMT